MIERSSREGVPLVKLPKEMATKEERCTEARKLRRIDEAFRQGDLEGLRAAVDDPTTVPNGRLPDGIGACLVYAIYHSPLALRRKDVVEVGDPALAYFEVRIVDARRPLHMSVRLEAARHQCNACHYRPDALTGP